MDFLDVAVRRYLASMASPAPAEDDPENDPRIPGLVDETN